MNVTFSQFNDHRPKCLTQILGLGLLLGLVSCTATHWDRKVTSWGSMREVMREGKTQARVSLKEAVHSDSTVGLGALVGLTGEIAIIDGEAWVSRIQNGTVISTLARADEDRATLLAISDVKAWREVKIDRDLSEDAWEDLLAQLGADSGFEPSTPWPFVIEGDLMALESHVLNGACPIADHVSAGQDPVRRSIAQTHGSLVGFFAPESGGLLVHHGQRVHAHVVVDAPELYIGHVNAVVVRAGARLSMPVQ